MPSDEVRLWAVSDIHTDAEENLHWVENLSDSDYQSDALIVAGDVSEHRTTLEATLLALKSKFGTVVFTPGNHDLWITPEDKGLDSLGKLSSIIELCQQLGVLTKPCRIGPPEGDAVWVCPLLSWHHQSFDLEPDIEGWKVAPAERIMTDYHACKFPEPLSMLDESVAEAIDALNGQGSSKHCLPGLEERKSEDPLVTFSHFLPRHELLPEKRFLLLPALPKASGSLFLGNRVKALGPAVHVFGHTHFGWDAIHDGTRYIQAALAYPAERKARWHTLKNAEFGRRGPLLIWSSVTGFAPKSHCRWSGYYEHHQREPDKVFELATYAAKSVRKLDARATECMPDFSHEDEQGQPAGNRWLARDPVLP